jgi:hypothetical protein
MKRWLILLSVGVLAFAGAANASVQKGDTTLELLGGWMTQNSAVAGGNDLDVWFLTGAVGYFITDTIQVSGVGLWSNVDMGTGNDVDIWGIGGRAKYHFMPTNQYVPYIGGQILWASADAGGGNDVDGMLWGPLVGLRYELNAMNDFFVEYQYHIWGGDIDNTLDDGHGVFIGIIHQFK